MSKVIAYSHMGGRDLYYGVPNLDGARLVCTQPVKKDGYVGTLLTFELSNGNEFELEVRQEV